MVSMLVFTAFSAVISFAFLCLCTSGVHGKPDCTSTFCFNIFSKRIDIDFNLFNNTEPLPIEDYIRKLGYSVESHNITTEDGYILTYHRIPHGKSQDARPGVGRGAVLVQHGLLGASSAWALDQQAIAYSLADAGYDVWLGNSRGNTYSRNHVKYDPDKDKKKFWDFSWHEMGYYDLPASIDYILNATGETQLFYAGHSMGTTMYFVLGATRPEYMDKVKAAVLMAPVAFPWNIKSPLANFLMRLHTALNVLVSTFGMYEIFPYSNSMLWVDNNICSRPQLQFICRDLMYFIGGFDDKELNRTSLPTVLQYMPAGASYKTLKHFRQINSKGTNFQQFDYGYVENLWKYHTLNPPTYNMTNIKAPIYAYYAMNDWLAVPQDVLHAIDHLPNVKKVTKVSDEKFNHLDFMWAIDAKQLVYDDIIATLHSLTTDRATQDQQLSFLANEASV